MKKKHLLIVIGTLLVISLLLGTSYAYWMMSKTQTEQNIVNTGCFATTFKEVEDSNINLTASYPMTDEAGMKTKPYEFTITNTCDTYASYNINMEVLNTTTLSHDLIKAVIDNNSPKIATSYTSTTATIEGATSYVLLSGGLDTDESQTFDFRMWIDEAGTLENSQNKTISTKIVVITTAANRPPKLTELLLAQYQEGNEVGLVKDSENENLYYFKGTNEEVANNFLWYGGHQWRVLEFDNSAKTITLITQQPLTSIHPASDVWTNEEQYNSSYINQWLNDYFWNSLDSSIRKNIQDTTFNVGIYGETEAERNVSEIRTIKKVGLLDAEQYNRSFKREYKKTGSYEDTLLYLIQNSLDLSSKEDVINFCESNRLGSSVMECGQKMMQISTEEEFQQLLIASNIGKYENSSYYIVILEESFLSIKSLWLLGNRYNTSVIRYVKDEGKFGSHPADRSGIRPVIKISDLTITSGAGTFDNSFKTTMKSTNTNDIQVGEYVNVPYSGNDNACGTDNKCTFRVVSKNNNKTKLVLNGLLPTTSAWANDASDNLQITDTIYTSVLNPFISNINNTYITIGIFGVGTYKENDSYTSPQSETITANVGLPTIGEIFSGNDFYIESRIEFIELDTTENPSASDRYWTMNHSDSSYAYFIANSSGFYEVSPSNKYGVRPTIYLKSDLTFTGGEGTPQNPYTLD